MATFENGLVKPVQEKLIVPLVDMQNVFELIGYKMILERLI